MALPNNRIHPKGTSFQTSTDGISYTTATDLVSITPPGGEMGDSDDTALDSANGAEVTTPGWLKATDAEAVVWLTKTQYSTWRGYLTNRTLLYFKIIYPLVNTEVVAGSEIDFQGYFKAVKESKAEKMSEDKIQATVTIRRTTDQVFTSGS